MATYSSPKSLLNHPALWQASQKQAVRPTIATGYQALDQAIYDGGWPQGALTELLLPQPGVGELKLLTPLLGALSKRSGYLTFVAPPYLPYASYFNQQNIPLSKLLIIKARSVTERVWATQQALACRSCSAVICWLADAAAYKSELRKLSLAARQGQSWGFILRPTAAAVHPSPAKLRITLNLKQRQPSLTPHLSSTQASEHQLEIIKQTGSWHGQKIELNLLPEQALWTSQCAKDWPTYQTQAQQKRDDLKLLKRRSLKSLAKSETTGSQLPSSTTVH